MLGVVLCVGSGSAVARAGRNTIAGVLVRYEDQVVTGLRDRLAQNDIAWPPARLTLVALKAEKKLEVWVAAKKGAYHLLSTYDILAASGGPGPKRKEGDLQVPEGIYRLPLLNPNSSFHLSIRVDYPNRDDIVNASVPEAQLGGDIYIHGGAASIGCIAIGDAAIEELFVLTARVSARQRRILIAPADLRVRSDIVADSAWVEDLYARLRAEMKVLSGN